jgi:hypothetical protein
VVRPDSVRLQVTTVTRRPLVVTGISFGIGVSMLVWLWFDSGGAAPYYVFPAVLVMACLGFYNDRLRRRERREK